MAVGNRSSGLTLNTSAGLVLVSANSLVQEFNSIHPVIINNIFS